MKKQKFEVQSSYTGAHHLKQLLREKGKLTAPDSLLPAITTRLGLSIKQSLSRFEVQYHPGQRIQITSQTGSFPQPRPREALLQIVAAGICGSDIRVVRENQSVSREPGHSTTLGHEGVGRIIALNDNSSELQAGDYAVVLPLSENERISQPVASCINPNCIGSGHTLHMGWDADGCFTDFMLVPTANLVRLPPRQLYRAGQQAPELREAVFALVEPMLCALSAYELIENQKERLFQPDLPSGRALVIGCGPIGILHCLALLDRGFEIWLMDSVEERAELARWCLGSQVHIFDQARHQGMFDLVMVTSSSFNSIRTGETFVRNGGIVYLFAGLDAIDRANMLAENVFFYEQLRRNARGTFTTPRLIGGEKSILYIGHSGYFEHLVPKAIETVATHAAALDRAVTGIIPGWSSPYVKARVPGGVDQVTEDGSPAIIPVLSGVGLHERHCKLLVLTHYQTEQTSPGHAEVALPFDMEERSTNLFDECYVY